MVLRAHERLARLRTKAKGDDRAQRLEALKVRPHRAQAVTVTGQASYAGMLSSLGAGDTFHYPSIP